MHVQLWPVALRFLVYVMLHSLSSAWLSATTLPGWYTSYRSLVTTSVTKRASAFAKNGTEATKALQLKFITSWEVIENFRLETIVCIIAYD